MQLSSLRFLPHLVFSVLLIPPLPTLSRADDHDEREVRISLVQGDVRLSRGDGQHLNPNLSWQQAQAGELAQRGYTLATANGRAEIEFENDSEVFLAENSVLIFKDVSTSRGRYVTRLSLVTGTATFYLAPANNERFYIQTPTDNLYISSPDEFFVRLDAYLDATGHTPQGEKGDSITRSGFPPLHIAKGQTVYFQGGEVVSFNAPSLAGRVRDSLGTAQPGDSWDTWVSTRVASQAAIRADALKAAGLSEPIPGLTELYATGDFFPCEPYGTCWEPSESDREQEPASPAAPSNAQASQSAQSGAGFQPQTVQWVQPWSESCRSTQSTTITRVARTPEELQKLLRLKEIAQKTRGIASLYPERCFEGHWILHRGRYARVLPHRPEKCPGARCIPVHPPRPLLVRVNGKVGFVPRHPSDAPGKPPLNLKNGVFISPSKPGEPVRRAAWNSSEKFAILDKAPNEFRARLSSAPTVATAAPQIGMRLASEAVGESHGGSHQPDTKISYDYKSQKFMMTVASAKGAPAKSVAIGGIGSNGKLSSFADGRSQRYANSFEHTGVAASYNGGAHEFGGRGFGSFGSSGGGGRGSGSGSTGSYSSGSHSSGFGSAGGSPSHSSGGGSSSGAASSVSAGASAGGGGGRPH